MSKIYKRWWFWLIIVLVIAFIGSRQGMKQKESSSPYISSYEWNLEDAKTSYLESDLGGSDPYKYVVLGVENKDKDLQAGEYTIKTNSNTKATFMIYIVDTYYKDAKDLPEPYADMVQGWDSSTATIKLNKGQYLYLVQSTNGEGKVFVEKK